MNYNYYFDEEIFRREYVIFYGEQPDAETIRINREAAARIAQGYLIAVKGEELTTYFPYILNSPVPFIEKEGVRA